MSQSQTPTFSEKFAEYFKRPVAEQAAQSLSDGVEIEFQITGAQSQEVFTFARVQKNNSIESRTAKDPHLTFQMTEGAAEQILQDQSDDVGAIGVNIAKLIVSKDQDKKVSLKLHVGFLTLMSKGYFGVVKTGGAAFASFLASRGLGGMGAIKSALKKIKS